MKVHEIIKEMQKIVDDTVKVYKTDLNYDIHALIDKQIKTGEFYNDEFETPFFWLARETGTAIYFQTRYFRQMQPITCFDDIIKCEWMDCRCAVIKKIIYYNGKNITIVSDPEQIKQLQLKAREYMRDTYKDL